MMKKDCEVCQWLKDNGFRNINHEGESKWR